MKKNFLFAYFILCSGLLFAQQSKRVLFIGNSYTGVNNLPQMIADVALSLGDTLAFDSNTPGGFTFNGHTQDVTSQAKIAQGNWDFVVLQEQSQLPSFPFTQFQTASLPYSITLCNQIRAVDSCTKPLFYMTWGRKNGDLANCTNYPPVCTYSGMQTELRARYLLMADTNNTAVAPVGAVWRELRVNNPTIELYNTDESHPSLEGSYLAACTFYASIFNKSPVGAGVPSLINVQDAQAIQQQVAATVFDSLQVWMIDTLAPIAEFVWSNQMPDCHLVTFDASNSLNVDSVYWDFGDGASGVGQNITHQYFAGGLFEVTCEAWRNCQVATYKVNVFVCPGSIDENKIQGVSIYPNPVRNKINVQQFGQEIGHDLHFKIYNLKGQKLLSGELNKEIKTSSLAAGQYILRLTRDGKASNIPFVKE